MREVFERLEGLGMDHYITGSEALGRYCEARQTMDVDIVLDVAPRGSARSTMSSSMTM